MTSDVLDHTHDADPPVAFNTSKPWTGEDDSELRRMKEAKYPAVIIAQRLGRTLNSVNEHWRWLNKGKEQRNHRRNQINQSRKLNYIKSGMRVDEYPSSHRPTPAMLAERDRRRASPFRGLIGAFCNDPPVGFSALDRKLAEGHQA